MKMKNGEANRSEKKNEESINGQAIEMAK